MKRAILYGTFCALLGLALGCQEKPEVAFEEYGETQAELPKIENLPATFEIPSEADSPQCVMREQAISNAASNARFQEAQKKTAAAKK